MNSKLVLINLSDLLENDMVLKDRINSDSFNDNIINQLMKLAEKGYYFGVFSKNMNEYEVRGILQKNNYDNNIFDYFFDNSFNDPFEFGEEAIRKIIKNDFEFKDVLVINCTQYISIFQFLKIKETIMNRQLSLKDVVLSIMEEK